MLGRNCGFIANHLRHAIVKHSLKSMGENYEYDKSIASIIAELESLEIENGVVS